MGNFFKNAVLNVQAGIVILIYLVLLAWWLTLQFVLQGDQADALQFWSGVYQIIAWYGTIIGFFVSVRWGGIKSYVGKAIMAFSSGLLFQVFGQTTYYVYVHTLQIPIPYPSIGDIGFFGSIPFYFYGAFMLAHISGAKISLQSFLNKVQVVLIPVIMLAVSYVLFLSGYEFDWSQPTKTFLDFGYPLGQAIYVSMALLAVTLSWKTLGGIMRLPIMCFIAALIVQYVCDFTFLYQASQGTFYAGGINDLMYATSYLLMAISLVYIGSIFRQIESSQQMP